MVRLFLYLKASPVSLVVTFQLSNNFPCLSHLSLSVRVIILPSQPPNLENSSKRLSSGDLK